MIPAYMEDALRAVQTQFPEAVIVGGALRDLWYKRPIKDIDVFVRHADDVHARLEKAFPALVTGDFLVLPRVCCTVPDTKDYIDWSGGDVRQVYEVTLPDTPIPLQIITTDGLTDITSLRDRVDFSFCQIAYDGRACHVGPKFTRTHLTKSVIYTGDHEDYQISRSARRAHRLSAKYPEMSFVFPTHTVPPGRIFVPEL